MYKFKVLLAYFVIVCCFLVACNPVNTNYTEPPSQMSSEEPSEKPEPSLSPVPTNEVVESTESPSETCKPIETEQPNEPVLSYEIIIETSNQFINDFDENKASYEMNEVPFFGFSTEGGSTQFYKKNNITDCIELSIFGETGKALYKYYFVGDSTVYVIEIIYTYDKPFTQTGFQIIDEIQQSYLLVGAKTYIVNNDLEKLVESEENIAAMFYYNELKFYLKD